MSVNPSPGIFTAFPGIFGIYPRYIRKYRRSLRVYPRGISGQVQPREALARILPELPAGAAVRGGAGFHARDVAGDARAGR